MQVYRARVFDEELRDLVREIHEVAMEAVWARSIEEAKELNPRLERGHRLFNDLVAKAIPKLYWNP